MPGIVLNAKEISFLSTCYDTACEFHGIPKTMQQERNDAVYRMMEQVQFKNPVDQLFGVPKKK